MFSAFYQGLTFGLCPIALCTFGFQEEEDFQLKKFRLSFVIRFAKRANGLLHINFSQRIRDKFSLDLRAFLDFATWPTGPRLVGDLYSRSLLSDLHHHERITFLMPKFLSPAQCVPYQETVETINCIGKAVVIFFLDLAR